MKNSNVKVFTTFTYSILLILILGSITFLVVQKIQLNREVDAYVSQIVERISNSYTEYESFSSTDFTGDVKETMRNFSQMIKVVTILGSEGNMLNRFRFDSVNPADDPNPYWQSEVSYQYNFLLYEQQKYDLLLSGGNNVEVQVLYERVPIELLKNILQFDTIVILALLVLSFLAFLFIPKRDTEESVWALRSVAEENDSLYHETEANQWQSEDLPAESKIWEDNPIDLNNGEDDDEFEHLLGSDDEANSDTVFETDSWDREEDEDDIDLSFNESVAEENDNFFDDDVLNASTSRIVKDDLKDDLLDDDSEDSLEDFLNDDLDDDLEHHSDSDDDLFTDLLSDEPSELQEEIASEDLLENVQNSDVIEDSKLAYELDSTQGDDLIADLDEGLGDDTSRELDDDAFLKILSLADDQDKQEQNAQEELDELELLQREIEEEPLPEDLNESPESQESQNDPFEDGFPTGLETGLQATSVSALDSQEIRNSLSTLLQDQQAALAVALISCEDDIQENLDLPPEAEIIAYAEGFALILPSDNVQAGVSALQKSVSQLPASHLQNLRMGITGISSARDVTADTALQEAQYALSNSDEQNNISIFDANDQVFNQQNE